MNNKVLFGQDLDKVQNGMYIVYKAVTSTIGAAGKNCMFRDWTTEPVVTNDGYTIAEMIKLEDPSERIGADFIKQASRRQNSEAGDGTTSVIAITYSMIENGIKKIKEGANAMKLKREIDACVNNVVDKLKKSAKKITDDKGLFDVANLSMENPEMARLVVDSINSAGENGRVVVQESNLVYTTTEEVKGIEFARGYITPYMITNAQKMTSELEDVHVLIVEKEFNLLQQLFPVIETLKAKGIDRLFVVCKGMIGEALGNVIANIQKGAFLVVAVQASEDIDIMDDIALLTGGQKINEVSIPEGLSPAHINMLGKAKRVIVHKDKTIIDSGYGNKTEIKNRVSALKAEIKKKESVGEPVPYLRQRVANLDGKVVYIKVGAPTQQEMKYLKLKVDDAVASASLAKQGGVVVGGGRALYDCGTAKPKNDGEEVVFAACQNPIRRIIENAKLDPDRILKSLDVGQAFNVLTEKPVKDFIKEGIVDPVDIEMWALRNAASIAGMYLTTYSAIVPIVEKKTCQHDK